MVSRRKLSDVARGDADTHRGGDEGQYAIGRAARSVGRPVQRADQEQQAERGECQALEDAQRARLQAHLQLQEDRVAQQARTDQEAQEELGAEGPAQWIHRQRSNGSGVKRNRQCAPFEPPQVTPVGTVWLARLAV
ncbi:hypothetical protein G6F68_019244 [Rhizopus microsporus]|nr:hypothetical protein G6F68_019244 [Rhizopus microsporus]